MIRSHQHARAFPLRARLAVTRQLRRTVYGHEIDTLTAAVRARYVDIVNHIGGTMFGKLKDLASAGAIEKALGAVAPVVREHLAKAQALGAASVRDDASYAAHIVKPAYLAVVAAVSGATKLIPQFEDRFSSVMHALRDELLVFEDDSVRLVEDYQARLQTLLVSQLKG